MSGIDVCGKTGTAQNPHGEDHAWFICFAPKVNPKIAMCILVENAGFGGTISAPIAQRLLTKFFFPHQKDSIEIKPPAITSAVPEKKIAKVIAKTNKTLAVNPR